MFDHFAVESSTNVMVGKVQSPIRLCLNTETRIRGVEVNLNAFLSLASDHDCSISRFGRLALVPLVRRLGEPQSLSGCNDEEKNFMLVQGLDLRLSIS
jgi:hypothetical protein